MKPHPATLKREALSLLGDGYTHEQIANLFGVGRTTITGWAKDVSKDTLRDVERPQAGRPRMLTDQDAHNLKLMFRRGLVKNAVQAIEEINKENISPVSVDTVRRALHRVGGKARKVIKRPLLTRQNMKVRKRFAEAYADWTEDDWSRVIWTDETMITRFRTDGGRYIWLFDEKDKTRRNKHVVDEPRVIGTSSTEEAALQFGAA